jgi:acyl carrier protein
MPNPAATDALDRLKTAFTQSLNLPSGTDFEGLAYGSTQGWDSVAHMALVAEIEAAFDIMLSTDDVIGMSSFAVAKETVARHGIPIAA